jgi:16S rRNA G966 N2-methylase RsmD
MPKAANTGFRGRGAPRTGATGRLYDEPLPAKRTGALYTAFPYPTKISPEAIALFIAAHTNPGDTVFDGFAGSGTTGLAALLCENPPAELRDRAKKLGLKVRWGARNAVLYELGALGSFVARTLTNPPDPKAFHRAADDILATAEEADGWMYGAKDPSGKNGSIRYVIWSDELRCPSCRRKATLWEGCVTFKPADISSTFTCPACGDETALDDVERCVETVPDEVVGEPRAMRLRRPVRVHGVTGKKTWVRAPRRDDLALLRRIENEPIPDAVPRTLIPWGDLYRSGYHAGITHLHHFYTRRNLIVFARLWERTGDYPGRVRDALRFWLLSYNASHATIMSRVVAKAGQDDLVTTSAQPGVLYVSGLPIEKNLFAGLRRKLKTIAQAFETIHGRAGRVIVRQHSSCNVELPDGSIDYIFTDPPFGGNIPYAEVNFINEAWLDDFTDRSEEIIVSKHQEKSVKDYENLLTRALTEARRILKPDGKGTVVFHSATAEVWNSLQAAYHAARFRVERASVLDKTQGSFKQVTTTGAVRGDPVLLLSKDDEQTGRVDSRIPESRVWEIADRLHDEARSSANPDELTAHRLYSRLVTHFLSHHQEIPLDADAFYQWLAAKHAAEVSAGVQG